MELLCYIAIMLAMGAIAAVCAWLDDSLFSTGPLSVVCLLSSIVFAIMFLLLVVAGIVCAFGLEV